MGAASRDPEAFLPLTTAEIYILVALVGADLHGYSIMQEILTRTGGHVRIGPATLYRSIKRLLQGDLIEEIDERPDPRSDDERRRYYRLTELGRRVTCAEVSRLEAIVDDAYSKKLMPGGDRSADARKVERR